MPNIPTNRKMWDMYVIQAKARFNKWPSLAASNWVHRQYTQSGGKFVSSVDELKPKERRDKAVADAKEERLKKRGLA